MDYDLVGQLTARHSSHYPEIIGQESNKPVRPQYHRVRYDYDEIGQLISAVNPNSRTILAYDTAGRLITETLISHLTQAGQYQAREQTLSHDYDELGNRIATTLPDGKVINQLYYGSGHLYNQSLHDPSTDEYIELRHSERNKLHQEISRQQGALESLYDYDLMGRLTKQRSKTYRTNHDSKYSTTHEHITIARDYHYDALGQLTHLSGHSLLGSTKRTQKNIVNQNQFTRNHQYQYDTQGRLTEHKLTDYQNHTGITEVFAFDPASNRVPVKVADDTTDNTQIDHGRPRELIQNGKRIRYTYDSHGRVLYKTLEALNNPDKEPRTALQLQYNANNELEKSLRTQYQGNQIIKTQTIYHYDAFGRRIAKHSETRHLTQNNDQLRQTNKTQHQYIHMLWDGDKLIQEYSDTHVYTTIYDQGSFKPIARLVWLKEGLTIAANDEPENDEDWYGHDKPATKTGIQVYHYHNDQLGTPNELTNDKGEVIWLADYEAWGNTAKVVWHKQVIDQMQVSQDELQPIRFQGQYFDTETGLHYNRFRYYDPDVGMFTSRDPIGLNGGMNVFAYAPNPTGWVDPLGLNAAVGRAVVGVIDDIVTLASRIGKTGARAKTGCTSCTKDDDEENSCRVLVNNVKSKLLVVKTRYYLLLIYEHSLYKNHRKAKDKHYKHGSWDGHIFKFKESQTELGQSIAQAGPKCMKYAPKDTDEWRYKEPPSMPNRDVGLEGYQNL